MFHGRTIINGLTIDSMATLADAHKPRMFFRTLLLCWLTMAVGCWACGGFASSAFAQETPPGENVGPRMPMPVGPRPAEMPTMPTTMPMPAAMPVSPNVPGQISQDILYLPDTDGRLKPVPINAGLEQYLDWLNQRESLTTEDQAEWTIRSLSAQGKLKTAANGAAWANLQFEMSFDVGQSSRWQSLPLMLGEGLLAGLTDSEEKTATSQLMVTRDSDSGQWLLWYRNRKSFDIVLDLLVPLRASGEQSQLLLTLPIASRTAMQIELDRPNLQVELLSQGFWERESIEDGLLIRVAGFRQSLDLRWSPDRPVAEMEPIVHVDSQIELSRSTESTLITARQRLNLDRGTLNTIRVKLPTGFQVDSAHSEIPIKYTIEATDPSWVTLNFSQPVQSSVQIDWKLSSPIRPLETLVTLEGFAVEGARTQTGRIGIVKSNQWRISQVPERSQNTFMINVRDFPIMGDYSMAYRYYGQPYRLVLNSQRVESQFHHTTFYLLRLDENQARLTVDFEVSPRNSVLHAVQLNWPEMNAGGWIPEKISQLSTGTPIAWQVERDNQLLLPLNGLGSRDVIRLEASCKISAISQLIRRGEPLKITLPRVASGDSILQDRVLKVSSSMFLPWETRLQGEQAERYRLKTPPIAWQDHSLFQQKSPNSLRNQWYHLALSDEPLEFRFHSIKQVLAGESFVDLEQVDLKNQRVSYSQRLQIHVSQLPAETLELVQTGLTLEEAKQARLRFRDEQGNELTPVISEISIPSAVETNSSGEEPIPVDPAPVSSCRFVFTPPSPILGKYVLTVYRDLLLRDLEEGDTLPVNLPLFQVPVLEELPCQFRNRSAYQIQLPENGWQLIDVSDAGPLWRQTELASEIPLQIHFLKPRLTQGTGPVVATAQSWLSGNGNTVSEITFQIARTPPALVLENANDFSVMSAYWRAAQKDEATLLQQVERAGQTILLCPYKTIDQPGKLVLTLQHRTQQSLTSLWKHQLKLPQHSLSENLSITRWTVNFPQGVYLLSPPRELTPGYQWAWQGFGFRRTNSQSTPAVSSGADKKPLVSTSSHPVYDFSSVGWPVEMRFRLIGRGLLMTLGTGIPILLAVFFAGKTPLFQLRGGLLVTLLIGAFATFQPEQFLVFMQPVALGTLFVVLTTMIALRMKRRQEEPTLIIVGTAAASAGEGGEPPQNFSDHGIGADDVTRVQPPRQRAWESSHS